MFVATRLSFVFAVAGAVALAGAGCGKVTPINADAHLDANLPPIDSGNAGDPCVNSIKLEDFSACVGKAFCRKVGQCGSGRLGDIDCAQLPDFNLFGLSQHDFADGVQASIDAGRTSYDPTEAAACLATLDTLSCGQLFSGGNPLGQCGFHGHITASNACGLEFECAPGSSCVDRNGNSFSGSCGNDICKPIAGTGAACVMAPCGDGDHCLFLVNAGNGQRQDVCAKGDAAARCNNDNDCDFGFYCNNPSGNGQDGAGSCTAAVAPGGACTRNGMCGALTCVGDNLVPAAGTCRDVSTVGATCDGQCLEFNLCSSLDSSVLGTCFAAPAEGAACPAGGNCGDFMICDDKGNADPSDDICRTPGDLGASCTNDGECNFNLFCTTSLGAPSPGTCHGPQLDNATCNQGRQCLSDDCSNNVCQPFQACVP